MTINDIAERAGVSISTVSKIINGKDSAIKSETRERVLKIVKEYRYVPYDFIKNSTRIKKFLLALVLSGMKKNPSFQNGFLCEAEKQGYQVQLCFSDDEKSEIKHIAALCKSRPDAVLWEPFDTDGTSGGASSTSVTASQKSGNSENAFFLLNQSGIPFSLLNAENIKHGICYDYRKAGYTAAQTLIKARHTKIFYMHDQLSVPEQNIRHGIDSCLFDHQLLYEDCSTLPEALSVHKCTAIICCSWNKALQVYEYASLHKLRIPHDLSLICIDDKDNIKQFPNVSAIPLSLFSFGEFVCAHIIGKTEKKKTDSRLYSECFACTGAASIDVPFPLQKKRIIVAGSINMDVLLHVKNYPQTGESISADNVSMMPGGKGINQSVGAARLGAKVSVIGAVGRDHDADIILNVLNENHVDTSAVYVDTLVSTGKAYIHIQKDGESGIVLYAGANASVCAATIDKAERLFEDASFCLLQTEIPMSAVKKTIALAQKNNIKIMLKPSAIEKIDENLLCALDYFIPNRKEICQLCPTGNTIEDKAALFLQKGVKTVIVTLGSEGCYVCSRDCSMHIPAAPFEPVDTTGAADAFIAALAVFLSEGKDLKDALRCAVYAAGFSTTRIGVIPALIDRVSLEHYIR